MRFVNLFSFALVVSFSITAFAAFCPECKNGGYTKDIGVCTQCKDGVTTSGSHKLCMKCSAKLQQCEHCLKPLAGAATTPTTRPIDPQNDGQYTEGPWRYDFKVVNKGTRSQGVIGRLFYNDKPVADAQTINDYYQTPWGAMYWVGEPYVPFIPHGWMLKPKISEKAGKQLPDPGAAKSSAPNTTK